VKAAPAEKNEKDVDPHYHLGAHNASLPSEVGGESINISQISKEQTAIRMFPANLSKVAFANGSPTTRKYRKCEIIN
jgi:hypothetical protein